MERNLRYSENKKKGIFLFVVIEIIVVFSFLFSFLGFQIFLENKKIEDFINSLQAYAGIYLGNYLSENVFKKSLLLFKDTLLKIPLRTNDTLFLEFSIENFHILKKLNLNSMYKNKKISEEIIWAKMTDSVPYSLYITSEIPLKILSGKIDKFVFVKKDPLQMPINIKYKVIPSLDILNIPFLFSEFEWFFNITSQNPTFFDEEIFGPLRIKNNFYMLKDKKIRVNDDVFIEGESNKVIKGPFLIYSTSDVYISGNYELKNFKIFCAGNVFIGKNIKIKRGLVFSFSDIIIKDSVFFSGMLIAGNRIYAKGNTQFYPWAILWVKGKNASIEIEENVNFEGLMVCEEGKGISISGNSIIKGYIHSNGLLYIGTPDFYGSAYSLALSDDKYLVDDSKMQSISRINIGTLQEEFFIPYLFGKWTPIFRETDLPW